VRIDRFAFVAWALVGTAGGVRAEEGWGAVDTALGQAGRSLPGEVHRYSWPRRDLQVRMDGVQVAPALALGSWAAFKPAGAGEAMTMGDLVLLPSEVSGVIRALQAGGLEVLAVHNHLGGETPQVMYVHFSGHGRPDAMARGLKGALDATATPLSAPPSSPPTVSAADTAVLETLQDALGRKGTMAGTVLQVGVPRPPR
jgi:hypothetical protein